MSKLNTETQRQLDKIRAAQPDSAKVRSEFRKANEKYKEAVIEGNGTPESGVIITKYRAIRDAYALYAIEKGISLEVR